MTDVNTTLDLHFADRRPVPAYVQHIIDVRNLWTVYGNFVVHRDLNLQIEAGEILSLVGGSGTGKTTLLRQMIGLERPTRGTVRVFGQELDHGDEIKLVKMRQRWGMLFQEGALFSALTVFDNVATPLREMRTLPEDLIHDTVMLKLEMVGIGPEHVNKMPSDLSGGMVKRVALARALATEPEVLFLDEPTAGLDPDRSESFVSLIRSLHSQLQLTVVMVTHDLDTLFSLSSRVAVLADQRVIATGSVKDILVTPHPFIKSFFLGERGQRALEVLREFPFVV